MRPGGARRNEKRNRLRGWKRRTNRPFVIRKLACSNCDRSVDCRSVVVGEDWEKGMMLVRGGKARGKRERSKGRER